MSLTVDMGRPRPIMGVQMDPTTGRVGFFDHHGDLLEPEAAKAETSYARSKGPKVVSRSDVDPNYLVANPMIALGRFDLVYVIDTNTKPMEQGTVSVSCLVRGEPSRLVLPHQTAFLWKPLCCFEFRNITEKPENVGWMTLVLMMMRSRKHQPPRQIAVVVDSDLGMLPRYNARTAPFCQDVYLPSNVQFFFASADSGRDREPNRTISFADSWATIFLNRILSDPTRNECLTSVSGPPYSHIRIWEPLDRELRQWRSRPNVRPGPLDEYFGDLDDMPRYAA